MSAVINMDDYRKANATASEKKMQDGFVSIPNAVEDALLASPLTHRQERVYRAILRKTLGFGKTSDFIATSQIASMTGIDESDVRKTLNDLMDMEMIIRGRRTKFGTDTTPVLTPESWNFKQGESPRLAPQTGRITPNKQGELPPTIDNYNRQTTTPLPPEGEVATATTETKVGKRAKKSAPADAILQAYRDALPELPQPQLLTEQRKRAIAARWFEMLGSASPTGKTRFTGEADGVVWFGRLFAKVRQNPHWMGENDRGWAADFDWLMKPANFAKVLEWRPVESKQ